MPYYKEIYTHEPRVSSYRLNSGTPQSAFTALKFDKVSTFRTRPTGKADYISEVSEMAADPYGYFLIGARDTKWKESATARSIDLSVMEPDTGHPFKSERFTRSDGFTWVEKNNSGSNRHYFDNCWISPRFPYANSTADATAKELWGKAAPQPEIFNLGTFAGELREGLPRLVPELLKGKVNFFKSTGSDYLNVQFGWIPFLNDLQNAARALAEATLWVHKPIGPIHRSRGKKVQIAPVNQGETGQVYAPIWGYIPSFLSPQETSAMLTARGETSYQGSSGVTSFRFTGNRVHLQTRTSWFEGNFFLLPKIGFDPSNYFSRLDALVDTKITPATLWELAPWSWLIDWFSHVGDSLTLAETLADDRIHAQYGYGMETYTSLAYFDGTLSPAIPANIVGGTTPSGSFSELYVRKERVRANPFGFIAGGDAALSESQSAILLALGLTKIGR
jgi:hypothetical protein